MTTCIYSSRHLARFIRRQAAVYVPGHEVRLIAREDRFGNRMLFEYDGEGRLEYEVGRLELGVLGPVYDLPVADSWAGLRPASRDHLPILGYGEAPGIVMATGFYRHGILLTPVTLCPAYPHTTERWLDRKLAAYASLWRGRRALRDSPCAGRRRAGHAGHLRGPDDTGCHRSTVDRGVRRIGTA